MEIYAIIMAGGVGTRFWPVSRETKPKQILNFHGDTSLLQNTVSRIEKVFKQENIFVVTNRVHKLPVKDQLSKYPKVNILEEPFGKNTSACIGLATAHILSINPESICIVFPSDHLIDEEETFEEVISKAIDAAKNNESIITIGIDPDEPETGYGYIQFEENKNNALNKVLTFAEKPGYATAKRFVEAGDFLWNSGIFAWQTSVILDELQIHMPDLFSGINEITSAIKGSGYDRTLVEVYGQLKNISIDYGVMEKSRNVLVLKGDFGWRDIGNWQSLYKSESGNSEENIVKGQVYTEKTKNSYINAPNKFTAVIGLEDIIFVDTHDATLICKKSHAQEVKNIVDHLRLNGMKHLI